MLWLEEAGKYVFFVGLAGGHRKQDIFNPSAPCPAHGNLAKELFIVDTRVYDNAAFSIWHVLSEEEIFSNNIEHLIGLQGLNLWKIAVFYVILSTC